jgi:RHS repeat-associated protein
VFTNDKPAKKPEIQVAAASLMAGMLLQVNPGDIYNEVLYYYINDHLGTPQLMADHEGQVVWRADYEPFGATNVDSTSSTVNQHRFPGQYKDEETGFHYNYHRYYDPRTGRYLTADPIRLDGGVNLFAYVGGNPIHGVDSDGLKIEVCCRLLDSWLVGSVIRQRHCYLKVDGTTYGLYPEERNGITIGRPRKGDIRDTGGICQECVPKVNPLKLEKCLDPKKCVEDAHNNYPVGGYKKIGPNSNTYAGRLARSCRESVPEGLGSAPGFTDNPPVPIK